MWVTSRDKPGGVAFLKTNISSVGKTIATSGHVFLGLPTFQMHTHCVGAIRGGEEACEDVRKRRFAAASLAAIRHPDFFTSNLRGYEQKRPVRPDGSCE